MTTTESIALTDSVSLATQQRLTALVEDTRTRMKRSATDIYHIGANLLEAANLLPHGMFLTWIDTEFGMGKSSAYQFMQVARTFQDKLPKNGSFDIAASALYLLSAPSTPDAARDEALARAETGERIGLKDVQAISQKHKPPALDQISADACRSNIQQMREYPGSLAFYGRHAKMRAEDVNDPTLRIALLDEIAAVERAIKTGNTEPAPPPAPVALPAAPEGWAIWRNDDQTIGMQHLSGFKLSGTDVAALVAEAKRLHKVLSELATYGWRVFDNGSGTYTASSDDYDSISAPDLLHLAYRAWYLRTLDLPDLPDAVIEALWLQGWEFIGSYAMRGAERMDYREMSLGELYHVAGLEAPAAPMLPPVLIAPLRSPEDDLAVIEANIAAGRGDRIDDKAKLATIAQRVEERVKEYSDDSDDNYEAIIYRINRAEEALDQQQAASGHTPKQIGAIVGLCDRIAWAAQAQERGVAQQAWEQLGKVLGAAVGEGGMLTSFELFAGCGGWTARLGDHLRPMGGVEIRPDIAAVWDTNHAGASCTVADVATLDSAAFPVADVLCMSPVCKAFSRANQKGQEGAGDLASADACARWIDDWTPRGLRYVFIENVPAYLTSESLRRIVAALRRNGWRYEASVLCAADYGVPQTRKRMILRAVRSDQVPRPIPTHQQLQTHADQLSFITSAPLWVGWYEAIADILDTLPRSQFANWQLKRLPKEIQSFLVDSQNSSQEWGKLYREPIEPAMTVISYARTSHLPRAFLVDCTPRTAGELTVRMDDEPSFTVTASQMRRPGNTAHAFLLSGAKSSHGDELTLRGPAEPAPTVIASDKAPTRAWLSQGCVVQMNPRALARFQSLPDRFQLPDTIRLASEVIGNAVPSLLARQVICQTIGLEAAHA